MAGNLAIDSSTSASSAMSTKRKIDEALLSLDEILRSGNACTPPQKKFRFPETLYSTLAKYGVRSSKLSSSTFGQIRNGSDQQSIINRRAPHLSAILARAASRRRRSTNLVESIRAAITSPKVSLSVSGSSEYRPSSITSFLSRLATFKLSTYSNKPAEIEAVAAAKAGWINDGKDRLVCGICGSSWVVAPRERLSKEAANVLLERQRQNLVNMHKDGCPWKVRQCDDTIYCIPLKSPSALAREIKREALELDGKDILEGVEIQHSLTLVQVQGLMQALRSVKLEFPSSPDDISIFGSDSVQIDTQGPFEPSEKAAITALFGWRLPSSQSDSVSNAPTRLCVNPTFSSRSLVAPTTPRRDSWASSASEVGSPRLSSVTARAGVSPPLSTSIGSSTAQRPESQIDCLYCALCQRRIGIWTFKGDSVIVHTPQTAMIIAPTESGSISNASIRSRRGRRSQIPKRPLNLLKEHRPYCPYVVRSTIVPSLPTSPSTAAIQPVTRSAASNSAMYFSASPGSDASYSPVALYAARSSSDNMLEGWQAVLTVVLRTGLGRRQRLRPRITLLISGEEPGTQYADAVREEWCEPSDVDNIRAMVDDVKSRGGRVLLSYVKSLFA